jgi:3-methyl-2-oxobutanoate hydroxymethyltransferase
MELEKAGAFSIVIEAVPEKLAREISQNLKIPSIGIGASGDCDGQVLVIDDLLIYIKIIADIGIFER